MVSDAVMILKASFCSGVVDLPKKPRIRRWQAADSAPETVSYLWMLLALSSLLCGDGGKHDIAVDSYYSSNQQL